MSARCFHRHAIAVRADTAVTDFIQRAVHGDKSADPARKIIEKATRTLKVAQPLLTGIADKQHAARRHDVILDKEFCRHQDRHHRRSVVADTGTMNALAVIDIGHRLQIGKHGIGVCRKNGDIRFAVAPDRENNIFRLVDIDALCPDVLEPLFTKSGSFVLLVGRRGDAAQSAQKLLRQCRIIGQKLPYYLLVHCRHPFYFSKRPLISCTVLRTSCSPPMWPQIPLET